MAWSSPAYERTAPLRAALERVTLPRYTLESTWVSVQVASITRRLAPHREAIAELPGFDIRHLDGLGDLAEALDYVQASLTIHRGPKRRVREVVAQALPIRQLLMAYADVLVLSGRFAPEVVARLRRGAGRLDLVGDLSALIAFYGGHPELTQAGSPVTPADLVRANEVRIALGGALGADLMTDFDRVALLRDRQALGHLLVTSRNQVRRAVDYLRYAEGDAGYLVPSLYRPRKGQRD